MNHMGRSVYDHLTGVIMEMPRNTAHFILYWKKILRTVFHAAIFSNLLLRYVSYSRPPWFDLPPPPYCSESESPNQPDLPPYRSRTGSMVSTDTPTAGSPLGTDSGWTRDIHESMDGHRTLLERTADPSNSLVNHLDEREA